MQIHRLKLSGFKSFVDAAELRIEPGLTGIVGPNGCGKSNLLEAIRWVMGEGSARAMRGGGMEDVIFAGTASRARRDFAEVTLHARQDAGEAMPALQPGADGELEISRRIERGAGSSYRANGRDVRAKDVALLFADAATGAHSPALVSQGKIAAVIAARPQDRRAMLEEAAGIAGLHVRRKDAEQKLRAAEANLARLEEVLADMDMRTAHLRRQARAAERYTELTTQIGQREARHLYARWREAAELAGQARSEQEAAELRVSEAQSAHDAAAATGTDATRALAAARSSAQSARDRANEASHGLAQLRTRLTHVTERLAEMERQAERIAIDREREGTLAQDAVSAITRLEEEIAAIKDRIAQVRALEPDRAARLTEAREAAREAELDLARAMALQAQRQAELRVADAALAAALSRLDKTQAQAARQRAELDALDDPAGLHAELTQAQDTIATAQNGASRLEAELAEAEQAREAAAHARAEAESALSAVRAELSALRAEHAALTSALERQRRQGDPILNHIRADRGYELALAAALGEDLHAGPEGPRRWMQAEAPADPPALPPGTQPLAAHVDAPDLLSIRLSQIAVARQDEGQMLAVGQRLVTLDGHMRRWDGFVVTAGGADMAQQLVQRNRLDELTALLPGQEAALETATAARERADAALTDAEAGLTALRKELSGAQKALADALRRNEQAQAALERLTDRRTEFGRRLDQSLTELDECRRDYDRAAQARAECESHDDLDAEVTALAQLSERAQQQVGQIQADAAIAGQALNADRQRLDAAQREIRQWQDRSGEAVRRVADMAERADAIAREQQALADAPAQLQQEMAAAQAEAGRLSQQAADLARTETQAQARLEQCEQNLRAAGEALGQAREQRAAIAARAESAQQRRTELARECGEKHGCPPAILPERQGFASDAVDSAIIEQTELERLTLARERLGPVNLVAATELAELEEQQTRSRAESSEIAQAVHQLRGSIGSLNREGRARLLAAFEAVDGHFRQLFTTLFNGGQARLELIESDDPLEAGLEILAQPPGKKLSTLTLLSGGEQALTAIALIFGLFLTNPAPICVLDEVDAPLDDANIERFCDLLDQMTRQTRTRYLIVTHNAVTMARMHRLFGVTMVEQGVSRLVSVDLGGAEGLLAAE